MELLAKKINIAFIVATLLFTSVAVFGVVGSVEGATCNQITRDPDSGVQVGDARRIIYEPANVKNVAQDTCLIECASNEYKVEGAGTSGNPYKCIIESTSTGSSSSDSSNSSTGGGDGVATTGDASGEECDSSSQICNPLESESLEDLLNRILEYLIFIAGSLTVTTIVLGGILYIVSGVSDKTAQARKMIQYSIGGLVLVLLARGIVSLVTILF